MDIDEFITQMNKRCKKIWIQNKHHYKKIIKLKS